MKKILFVLTLFICALQLAGAQDKNSLRVGLGADYFDTSNESDSNPGWSYPSLFAEYGHRFNSVFSAVATINTDFRRYQREIGEHKFVLSVCGMAKPFAKMDYLNRLEIGLGFAGQYRDFYDGGRLTMFEPGLDIPVRVYILDTAKFDLSLASYYRFFYSKGEGNGFRLYDINLAVMFGVKF